MLYLCFEICISELNYDWRLQGVAAFFTVTFSPHCFCFFRTIVPTQLLSCNVAFSYSCSRGESVMLQRKPRPSDANVLPITSSHRPTTPGPIGLTRRLLRYIGVLALMSLVALFILPKRQFIMVFKTSAAGPTGTRKPPLYERFREAERQLPHYDMYEKNRTVKYFWAAQHAHSECRVSNVDVYILGDAELDIDRFRVGKCDAGLYHDGFTSSCSRTFVSTYLHFLSCRPLSNRYTTKVRI